MFNAQVKVNIQHTPKGSQFLNLIDQSAAIHKLTKRSSAPATIDAQPDGRRPNQFVDHPKIDPYEKVVGRIRTNAYAFTITDGIGPVVATTMWCIFYHLDMQAWSLYTL